MLAIAQKNGFPGVHEENFLQNLLKQVAEARTSEARGEEPKYWKYVPETPEEIANAPSTIVKEASCFYPTTTNRYLVSSNDKLAAWDAFSHIETVSPRPILLIVGSKADTLYYSADCYQKALEPKEIFTIQDATHVDLYDKPQFVEQVVAKLVSYFNQYLA